VVAAAAGSAVGIEAEPAHADLFGGDLPLLAAILTQAIAQASSLANMVLQLANQIRMMTTLLQQVGSGSFPALISFIQSARSAYSTLTLGVQSMSYRLSRIDADYQKLFPQGAPPQGTTTAQHRAQLLAWNQEVLGAAQIASRQQTSLATLDAQAAETQQILQQSAGASGVVEELQLIAQLIGVTNSELGVLGQTLATSSRALTDMAALSASERQQSLGKGDDARAGYTDKGAPVSVPRALP
jgi:P-type conjugative transfer protein TrbJ